MNPKYRIVLIGDAGCGKTSLIWALLHPDSVLCDAESTIGASMTSLTCEMGGKAVDLNFWDTPGSQTYRNMLPLYLRDASVVIIVYSITDQTSFQDVGQWYQSARNNASDEAAYMIIANKRDLSDSRVVSEETGRSLAASLGVTFMETSAMSREGLPSLMEHIYESVNYLPTAENGDVNLSTAKGNSRCC